MNETTATNIPPPNTTNPVPAGPRPPDYEIAYTCYELLASSTNASANALMGVVHTYYQFPYITLMVFNALFGLLVFFGDGAQSVYDRKMPDYLYVAGYEIDTEFDVVEDLGIVVFNMNVAAIIIVEGVVHVI